MTAYCQIQAPYPVAQEGYKRVVFALDPQGQDEENEQFMLQLLPGRTMEMSRGEAANTHVLGGGVEEHTVDGWGYPYYVVQLSAEAAATRMMIMDENADERVNKFVGLTAAPIFRYNSQAPVVVYLPEDAELRYSVWTGSEQMQANTE